MKCVVSVLLVGGFLSTLSLSMLTPLFPAELERRRISSLYSGLVLAFSSLPYTLTSLAMTGGLLNAFGRANWFAAGMLLTGFSFITFGYLHFVADPRAFLWVAFMGFLLQGVGGAAIQTASYSMLTGLLDRAVSRATTSLAAVSSLGLALGPLCTSLLFHSDCFLSPFLVVGGCSFALSLGRVCLQRVEPAPAPRVANQREAWLRPSEVLQNKRAVLAFVGLFLMVVCQSFFSVTLFHKLSAQLSLTPAQISRFYFAFSLSGALVCCLLPCLPESCERRNLSIPATLLTGLGVLLIGPSKTFGFPNDPGVILAGLVVAGAASNVPVSLATAEVIQATRRSFFRRYQQLANMVASLTAFWTGLGMLGGPLVGSLFQAVGGFRHSCEAVSVVVVLFAWVQTCIYAVEIEYNVSLESPRNRPSMPHLGRPVGQQAFLPSSASASASDNENAATPPRAQRN